MVRAKKLPASQPLHVYPGTALSSLFWDLSKAHHGEEAISVGRLWVCQRTAGGRNQRPAQQLGHNEEENSYYFIPIKVTTTMHFCPTPPPPILLFSFFYFICSLFTRLMSYSRPGNPSLCMLLLDEDVCVSEMHKCMNL